MDDMYAPGKRFRALCTAQSDGAIPAVTVELEIVQAYRPFTTAAVCQVRPLFGPKDERFLPDVCIMKGFDRRHATHLRCFWDDDKPHSIDTERMFTAWRARSGRNRFWEGDETVYTSPEELDDDGELEAYIAHQCRSMWRNEVGAYERLKSLQGSLVPRLLGCVKYDWRHDLDVMDPADDPSASCNEGEVTEGATLSDGVPYGEYGDEQFAVFGVLLEYVPGLTLRQFLANAARLNPPAHEAVAQVCETAVQTAYTMGTLGFHNEDVRLDNILVVPHVDAESSASHAQFLNCFPETIPRNQQRRPLAPESKALYPTAGKVDCVFIDFALSRVRFPDETDEQWRALKQNSDEEGAVGCVARMVFLEQLEEAGARTEEEERRVWQYERKLPWYRKLNPEEQKEYETRWDIIWGVYQLPKAPWEKDQKERKEGDGNEKEDQVPAVGDGEDGGKTGTSHASDHAVAVIF